MKSRINFIYAGIIMLGITSCKKEIPIYEVNTEQVNLNTIEKNALKRQTEFISQAYADLFGKPINTAFMDETLICYHSFSDYELVEDMVIRHLIKAAANKIPDRAEIIMNLDSFTVASYKKFYHRSPNELELWNVKNSIQSDTAVVPDMVYYTMMTSDEYKFN